MNKEQAISLLRELKSLPRECEWVEFKVNNCNPFEIGQYLSALSNSACYHHQPAGYLVFGIQDVTHQLVGTNFSPKTEKKGNQELENWLATQLNPRIDFTIEEFEFNEKKFAIFKIDSTKNTPVSFQGEPFIRIGTYKKPLDEHPERERKIWNNSVVRVFEKATAASSLTQEDILKLVDYVAYFEMLQFPLPDNREGIIAKLIEDRIINEFEGQFSITNIGAIMFAKNIEKFDQLSRKAIRVILYDGINRIKTRKEQIGVRGYAVGFEGLISFLNSNLPTTEVIEGALRKVVSTYPSLAIREIVANAIIHQDFAISGTSPMIEIFDNRVEITNPGKPLIDPLRFVDHSPESRNELLARFMRRVNICEERGSGIDKVVFECERHQLPAPDFIVGDNYTRVILYAPKSLRQMDKQDKVRACYQHSCLKYVSGEIMTNQSLRDRLGVENHNYSTVSRIISDTKESGLIKDYDPDNRSRTYAKYLPFWA